MSEKPNAIKVRIAVAVDPRGTWYACGWGSLEKGPGKDTEMMGNVLDAVDDGEARYWLEAELPIPQVLTVTVEPAPASDAG